MDHEIQAATIHRSDEQVTYMIKTNVHTVSTHTNKGLIQWNADVVYTMVRIIVNAATTLQRNNIRPVDYGPVSYTHLDVYKRQVLSMKYKKFKFT